MSETTEPGAPEGAPEIVVDPTAAAAPPEHDTAPPGSAETDAADAGADPEPAKPPKGVQKRIDELTANWRTAERRAEQLTALLERAMHQQPQQSAPQATADAPLPPDLAAHVGPAPDPSKFPAGEFDPEYIRAAARHDVRVDQARMVAQQRMAQARSAQAAFGQRVQSVMQAAIAADPAIADTITAPDFPMAQHVVHALTEAEDPGSLLAHLAKNRAEVERLSKLSPLAAAKELGKIEARLAAAPPPAPPSAAPPPPRPVRGAGSAPVSLADMSVEQIAKQLGYG